MAQEDTVSDIAKQLICQCGCGRILADTTPGGGIRDEMYAIIEQKLAQGESQEEILDYFVARYGPQVLSHPISKRGFNLVAWVLPFVAILAGGVVIYLAVKAWVRRGRQPPISARSEEEDEEYRKRLEKELEEFSEGGFR